MFTMSAPKFIDLVVAMHFFSSANILFTSYDSEFCEDHCKTSTYAC